MDGINAFGENERDCIRAALEANPSMHMISPILEMLYERSNGQLWYYDEFGNYIESHYDKCGVRQDCVLGAFFSCLVMRPVYARLAALIGPNGALLTYFDDAYFVSDPDNMTAALVVAPSIYRKVGLRIH